LQDKTIIYYTANKESEGLTRLVQKTLLKAVCGLSIISVSQKPIDFGYNICVGDVGFSSHNSVQQVLIGAEKATTRYIALAEADCLYSKEHFEYIPPRKDMFYYDRNVWMLREKGFIKRRATSIAGITVGRKKLIKSIKISLRKRELWYLKDTKSNLPKAYRRHGWHSCRTKYPILMIDHRNGLHPNPADEDTDEGEYCDDLYPWGKAIDILNECEMTPHCLLEIKNA